MPPLLQAVRLLLLSAYVVAWWFALWLVLGRPRRSNITPFLGMLLLGFAVPAMLADLADAGCDALELLLPLWPALPLLVLYAFVIRWWLRRSRSRGGKEEN